MGLVDEDLAAWFAAHHLALWLLLLAGVCDALGSLVFFHLDRPALGWWIMGQSVPVAAIALAVVVCSWLLYAPHSADWEPPATVEVHMPGIGTDDVTLREVDE
jgi:hypothetical protein